MTTFRQRGHTKNVCITGILTMSQRVYSNSQLIEQMQESWGQQFEQLNISEKIWLLSYVVGHMGAEESEFYKPNEIDNCVSLAGEQISELSFYQQIDLAKALIHQIENNYLHG